MADLPVRHMGRTGGCHVPTRVRLPLMQPLRALHRRIVLTSGAAANDELRREIAERKIVEEKLRQDERELRRITDAIPQLLPS
jgi:hypothetical protein